MGRCAVTDQLFSLAGKKALVTGASRGIGQVIAVAFARAGADVAVSARTEAGLAETAKQIRDLGRQAVEIPADLSNQDAAEDSIRTALKELGQLDVVVNNAGGSSFVTPFLDMRQSGWDKVLRLNLDATMWICQAAGAHMTARGTGSVINVASVAGLAGAPFLAPYGAAKAAVVSLTKTLAVEWGRTGVRINALCPGWTATELNRVMWDSPDGGAATIVNVPMARWGRAEEMGGPAVFLASDASSFMTGQVLVIDGGQTATA
jgi:NAD(P)-dependent dehydrogenase (short-subunit alcohol dehydrogenase family)